MHERGHVCAECIAVYILDSMRKTVFSSVRSRSLWVVWTVISSFLVTLCCLEHDPMGHRTLVVYVFCRLKLTAWPFLFSSQRFPSPQTPVINSLLFNQRAGRYSSSRKKRLLGWQMNGQARKIVWNSSSPGICDYTRALFLLWNNIWHGPDLWWCSTDFQ